MEQARNTNCVQRIPKNDREKARKRMRNERGGRAQAVVGGREKARTGPCEEKVWSQEMNQHNPPEIQHFQIRPEKKIIYFTDGANLNLHKVFFLPAFLPGRIIRQC